VAFGSRVLTGPRLPPARGDATHLVVLCHGYGADGNDLIGLAPYWQRSLPTAAFVAPNAPERCAGSPGYQWFPIARLDPSEMQRGVEQAAPVLEGFVESELVRYGLPPDRLALVGFSQGAMLSLHVGLCRAIRPATVIGFSGMFAAADEDADRVRGDAPPVLLVHGDADPMIPVQALFLSASALGCAGVAVQWHVSPGVGHAIDEAGLALAESFLAMAFRGQLRRPAGEICCPTG
jgi:phospholipase/carboxylesterase